MSQLDADFLFPRSLHFRFEFAYQSASGSAIKTSDMINLVQAFNDTLPSKGVSPFDGSTLKSGAATKRLSLSITCGS
jgi:hypothetical protein